MDRFLFLEEQIPFHLTIMSTLETTASLILITKTTSLTSMTDLISTI